MIILFIAVLLRTEVGLNLALSHHVIFLLLPHLLAKDRRTVILCAACQVTLLLHQVARLLVAKGRLATHMLGVMTLFLIFLEGSLFLINEVATGDSAFLLISLDDDFFLIPELTTGDSSRDNQLVVAASFLFGLAGDGLAAGCHPLGRLISDARSGGEAVL